MYVIVWLNPMSLRQFDSNLLGKNNTNRYVLRWTVQEENSFFVTGFLPWTSSNGITLLLLPYFRSDLPNFKVILSMSHIRFSGFYQILTVGLKVYIEVWSKGLEDSTKVVISTSLTSTICRSSNQLLTTHVTDGDYFDDRPSLLS